MKNLETLAEKSKHSSLSLLSLNPENRKKILTNLANILRNRKGEIKEANEKDVVSAKENNLNPALIDRLILNDSRIESMASGVEEISAQKEVVGEIVDEYSNPQGVIVQRKRVPLGVILMIFESRPNVVIDCAALAIKSSNSIILKGGKEAKHSNKILGEIVQEALQDIIPKDSVSVLASDDREAVNFLLSLKDQIDVVIPRGGERLIQHVYDNAKMPVIAHFLGLCHMYIDKYANQDWVTPLVLNAKTQRTGVCNAIETLIIHQEIFPKIEKELFQALLQKETELRVDDFIRENSSVLNETNSKVATKEDWNTEYLENILSIKTVASLDEAIKHIQTFGTFHTEAIISDDENAQKRFEAEIDASCIAINSSTRFNDGGQLGLGAELGISTTKFHAYGPMGAGEMTTSRFVIKGNGNVRP